MSVLYAYVRLPDFPLERCGYSTEEHLALWEVRHQISKVTVVCDALRAYGIQPGMSTGEARALCHDVILVPRQVDDEREDRRELTRTLHRWGDRVRQDGDEGWILEVGGLMALYGGPEGIADHLRAQLSSLGHRVQVALAEHPMAARILAVTGEPAWSERAAADRLAPLPLEALPAPEHWIDQLIAVGCRTLGDLAALDPASVAGRHGPAGRWWHQVVRGAPGEPWTATEDVQEHPGVAYTFDDEVHDASVLLARLQAMIEACSEGWAHEEAAPEALRLELRLANGEILTKVVRRHQPSRSPGAWMQLWRAALSDGRLPAPVLRVHLWPVGLQRVQSEQLRCGERRKVHEEVDQLVERLRLALGQQTCVQVQAKEAWMPEQRWSEEPGSQGRAPRRDPVQAQEGWRARHAPSAPSRLRRRPRPVQVRLEDGRPVAIRGPRSWAPVQPQEGPIHLRHGWWTPGGGEERCYHRVGSHRGDLSLYERQGLWFHQGWFD